MEKRMQANADEFKLREIDPSEASLLEPLMAELARHHGEVSRYFAGESPVGFVADRVNECAADLKAGKAHVLVAEAADKIVGFCKFDLIGDAAYIDELVVVRDYRGKGVGSLLMDEAEREVTRAGAKTCELRVVVGNDAARAFYERRGYLPSVLEMKRVLGD